jgi:hypothetical protein
MMSAHDKGVRSVMKDVLEYFCYVLVRVKVTLEDIQVTEEHELPEKERARREKLEEYEERFKDDVEDKFNEGLEVEFGLKAKVENAMKDVEKVKWQIRVMFGKIEEDMSELESDMDVTERVYEDAYREAKTEEEKKRLTEEVELKRGLHEMDQEKLVKKQQKRE